jgi:hypothetical protein
MSYLKQYSTRRTPQAEPIPGAGQMPNSAGGFAWAVDDWTRLRRFLILGSEGGSYYAGEREHGRGDRRGQPGWSGAQERSGRVCAGRVRGPRR